MRFGQCIYKGWVNPTHNKNLNKMALWMQHCINNRLTCIHRWSGTFKQWVHIAKILSTQSLAFFFPCFCCVMFCTHKSIKKTTGNGSHRSQPKTMNACVQNVWHDNLQFLHGTVTCTWSSCKLIHGVHVSLHGTVTCIRSSCKLIHGVHVGAENCADTLYMCVVCPSITCEHEVKRSVICTQVTHKLTTAISVTLFMVLTFCQPPDKLVIV